jgi:hypothetical protein
MKFYENRSSNWAALAGLGHMRDFLVRAENLKGALRWLGTGQYGRGSYIRAA